MLRPKMPTGRAWVVVAFGLALAQTAFADAQVTVELKDKAGKPTDGEVSLHAKSGPRASEKVASCVTQAGRCEMANVPGGLYEAHVKPKSGPEPKPRVVMIPPEGKTTLIVNTGT
jgi:hypothetical protein